MSGSRTQATSKGRPHLRCQALVLRPAGSGTADHLDEQVVSPEEIKLTDGQFEVGREESASIQIPYPTVSSRHAFVRVAGETVSITDLNSTNGTFIDDAELVPMEAETLSVGQKIIFGDSFLAQYRLERRPE